MSIGERLRLLDERVLGPPKHNPWRREEWVGLAASAITFGTHITVHSLAAEDGAWPLGVLMFAGGAVFLVKIARRTAAVRTRVFVVVATLSFVAGVLMVVLVPDQPAPGTPDVQAVPSRLAGSIAMAVGFLLGKLARERRPRPEAWRSGGC